MLVYDYNIVINTVGLLVDIYHIFNNRSVETIRNVLDFKSNC